MEAHLEPVARPPAEAAFPGPAEVYIARLAQGSRRTMRAALENLAVLAGAESAAGFPWDRLRYEHTTALRSLLVDAVDDGRLAVSNANKHLSALRGVLKEAWRLGALSAEDYQRAVDVPNISGEALPAGRALEAGEIDALFRACMTDVRPAGARDAALLACLYSGGLRRSEVVALEVDGYDEPTGRLRVKRAKGRKQRDVWLTGGARDAMADWLAVRGTAPGPLFVAVSKGGALGHRAISGQAVRAMVDRRARASGLAHFTPHDMRRTFVGDLLDAGADLVVVQKLAGHAQPTTTARYDRRDDRSKRKASGLLHVPYRRRPAGG